MSEHRLAMLRNQAQSLLRHERIRTTVPRAKELRPFVERLITIAKRGLTGGDAVRAVHARRLVRRDIQDLDVVSKIFDGIAPRFETRPGGYTRLLRFGVRRGDSAEMAQVELVGSEFTPDRGQVSEVEETAPVKPKGVGGRLRAAARRIRGKAPDEVEAQAEPKKRKTTAKKRASKPKS